MRPPLAGSAPTRLGRSALELPADAASCPVPLHLDAPAERRANAPDIQGLTRAARYGDAEAFSRIYDLFSFRLYKLLLVLTRGDENKAREICQTVFIKLAKRCYVFTDEQRLWAWLCVIAKNTFLDDCRARQRHDRFLPLDALPVEPGSFDSSTSALAALLGDALAGLPPEERELLQAAYIDQQPLQELADRSGQTYKAVESKLGRLRRKLKEQLLKKLRHENQ